MMFTEDAARETITIIKDLVGRRVISGVAPAANKEDFGESRGYRGKEAKN